METIAYKLVRLHKNGSISSLFINKKVRLSLNKWLKSKSFPTKGFAIRPGWHCTVKPIAPHLSKKNRVWVQVEIKDFKTINRPANQGGKWYLSKYMKIERLLK